MLGNAWILLAQMLQFLPVPGHDAIQETAVILGRREVCPDANFRGGWNQYIFRGMSLGTAQRLERGEFLRNAPSHGDGSQVTPFESETWCKVHRSRRLYCRGPVFGLGGQDKEIHRAAAQKSWAAKDGCSRIRDPDLGPDFCIDQE